MRVAIHQPEYLPCLPLLAKLRKADVVVLLDDVQFNRASLQHRAKVAGPSGLVRWVSIPYRHAHPQRIMDLQVADESYRESHMGTLGALYRTAPAFATVEPIVADLYERLRFLDLSCVAVVARASMDLLMSAFGVAPARIVRSSTLAADGMKGDRVLDICRRLKASTYIAGRAGSTYLDRDAFAAAGVAIEVSEYEAPRYREGQPEDAGLSGIDAWMWLGERCGEVIR